MNEIWSRDRIPLKENDSRSCLLHFKPLSLRAKSVYVVVILLPVPHELQRNWILQIYSLGRPPGRCWPVWILRSGGLCFEGTGTLAEPAHIFSEAHDFRGPRRELAGLGWPGFSRPLPIFSSPRDFAATLCWPVPLVLEQFGVSARPAGRPAPRWRPSLLPALSWSPGRIHYQHKLEFSLSGLKVGE